MIHKIRNVGNLFLQLIPGGCFLMNGELRGCSPQGRVSSVGVWMQRNHPKPIREAVGKM